MRSLNVIDLDGTLIGYDSFRLLVYEYLRPSLVVTALLRRLGVLTRRAAAARLMMGLRAVLADQVLMRAYALRVKADVRQDLLERVRLHTDADTTNLLLSASPHAYVAPLAESLGFEGVGSRWQTGRFFHCYGRNKLCFVRGRFPQQEYEYRYAVSDRSADLALLRCFEHFELLTSEKTIPGSVART